MPGIERKHDGVLLEEITDACEEINQLKPEIEEMWKSEANVTAEKDKLKFRQYEDACERVKNFYKEQHEKQTVAYNLKAREDFKRQPRARMSVWQAIELLNTLIDESDPDTSLSQIEHLLQTAEAIRKDGKPEWMQSTLTSD